MPAGIRRGTPPRMLTEPGGPLWCAQAQPRSPGEDGLPMTTNETWFRDRAWSVSANRLGYGPGGTPPVVT